MRSIDDMQKTKKIDNHIYHNFYVRSKGNQFKNKRVLVEAIHKAKLEKAKPDERKSESYCHPQLLGWLLTIHHPSSWRSPLEGSEGP